MTLVRVFRGHLKKGMRLLSPGGSAEVLTKLYEPLADDFREINEVSSGNIAVCSGLKVSLILLT